jgi:predicted transcriptional regulator
MRDGASMLRKLFSSETKGELLILFRKNPGMIDTIEGVARRIGRKPRNIEADVKEFLELGLLSRKRIGRAEVIFLNMEKDKEIQEIVAKHLASLKGNQP